MYFVLRTLILLLLLFVSSPAQTILQRHKVEIKICIKFFREDLRIEIKKKRKKRNIE